MSIRIAAPILAAAVAGFAMTGVAHAQANVMKECGQEYQAAKAANQLNGQTWNQYLAGCRVRHAGQPAAAAPAAPAAAPAPTTTAAPANPLKPAPTAAAPTAAPAAAGAAVFPSAINPKYSSEKPGKQREQTCLDQYNANKATNGNGGLKWIMKGGGYYSECNKRLKG
ncbi:MAG: hypothetical protein KGM42_07365 [Hyphomicrobiales bacterium]|nr:hypothetical protein [Hyphomicrobiales bacterium]